MTNPKEIAKRAEEWASSEEGRKAIDDALKRADETIRQLEEARRIDRNRLHEPLINKI